MEFLKTQRIFISAQVKIHHTKTAPCHVTERRLHIQQIQNRVCSSRRMEPSSSTKPRAAGIDPKVPSGAQAQMPSTAPSAKEKTITK